MSILSRKIPVAPVKKRKYKKRKEKLGIRTGRWNRDECTAFADGLKRHGKGRWKQIAKEIPTRYVLYNDFRKFKFLLSLLY